MMMIGLGRQKTCVEPSYSVVTDRQRNIASGISFIRSSRSLSAYTQQEMRHPEGEGMAKAATLQVAKLTSPRQ